MSVKKSLLVAFMTVFANSSFAQSGGLELPGEKWLAKFDKFVCAAFGETVARPAALEKLNVQFEQVTTDATLDNALLKATFVIDGQNCRYDAILFADNALATTKLVNSSAYSVEATGGGCEQGKAVLDAALIANSYLYYGHPHNLAIMMPGVGGAEICGGTDAIGANFVVSGRVNK